MDPSKPKPILSPEAITAQKQIVLNDLIMENHLEFRLMIKVVLRYCKKNQVTKEVSGRVINLYRATLLRIDKGAFSLFSMTMAKRMITVPCFLPSSVCVHTLHLRNAFLKTLVSPPPINRRWYP